MRGIVDYLVREIERLGVEIELDSNVTVDSVGALDGEGVIVATGSRARATGFSPRPDVPGIPGIETAHAVSGRDVLGGGVELGDSVLIVDFAAHIEGLSVADHLIDLGKDVELVTQHLYGGAKIGASMWLAMMKQIPRKGVRVTPETIVTQLDGDRVVLADVFSGRETSREGIDTVVVVGDMVAEEALLHELREARPALDILAVGDCVAPRYLDMAILDGNRAGRAI
jgi:phytoene dehydrogenase-like protein